MTDENDDVMGLNFGDERWVKLYTRDTVNWQMLSFEAQGLLTLLLRRVDRAGVIPNRHGKLGVFVSIGHRHRASDLEPALDELLESRAVCLTPSAVVLPKFLPAQEAPTSDAQRQRDHRERRASFARAAALGIDVTNRDKKSRPVTTRVEETRGDKSRKSSYAATRAPEAPSQRVESKKKRAKKSLAPSSSSFFNGGREERGKGREEDLGALWLSMIRKLRSDSSSFYAAKWLEALVPVSFVDGVLELIAKDAHFYEWVNEHYMQTLEAMAAAAGFQRITVATDSERYAQHELEQQQRQEQEERERVEAIRDHHACFAAYQEMRAAKLGATYAAEPMPRKFKDWHAEQLERFGPGALLGAFELYLRDDWKGFVAHGWLVRCFLSEKVSDERLRAAA